MDVLRSFAAFLLICCVVDMLLPSGSMRSYARFAMGILIVLAMAGPLTGLLNAPLDLADEAMERINEAVAPAFLDTRVIENMDTRRAMAVLENAGISNGVAYIEYGDGCITHITLTGSGGDAEKNAAVWGISALFSMDEGRVAFE